MSVTYHKPAPDCTVFVLSRDDTTQSAPTVRQAGFGLERVERMDNGDVDPKSFNWELRIFLQRGVELGFHCGPNTPFTPPFVLRINPLRPNADEAKKLEEYWAGTNALCAQLGIAHPYNDQLKLHPLQQYIAMCGYRRALVSDQWRTPELAADLGFEPWELWPSLRKAAVQGISNAIASAQSFATAIDCLPVGKDIRNRLQAHVQAHIDLLRRMGGSDA